jgi:transposase InsO family protein
VEKEIQRRRDQWASVDEAGPEDKRSRKSSTRSREQKVKIGAGRIIDRASVAEKKRQLGLYGTLRGRHLSGEIRSALLAEIESGVKAGESFEAVCQVLELNSRAVYRWKSGVTSKAWHGGGGGKNKITPLEEKRVVALAKRFPHFRCRRIAYTLEREAKVFMGKTKVAEILKKHGLNHEFERGIKKPLNPPGEILLHEPWRKNLLWGMDWTYLKIEDRFWFLLVLLDWYSRKILAWGLYPQITQFEVVAVVTSAVAVEEIDQLPDGELKPRVVADHGSANIAKYTQANIKIQGLELWLSGIGRPTGNARTERVIGTLKREEIHLQSHYENENEARSRIEKAIWDYNFRRPNAGNGGFAPNSVHLQGRYALTKRRKRYRQSTENRRRKHWNQEPAD